MTRARLFSLLFMLLATGAAVVVVVAMRDSWRSPAPQGKLILAERLGLAGQFCDQLPVSLNSGLTRFAGLLESDPVSRGVLYGSDVSKELSERLTPGYALWAAYQRDPSPAKYQELRELAYAGLIRLNLCFFAFLSLSLAVTLMAWLHEDPQPVERLTPEGQLSTARVLWPYCAWTIFNLALLPHLLRLLPASWSRLEFAGIAQLLSYGCWVVLLGIALRGLSWRPWGTVAWRTVGVGYLTCLLAIPAVEWMVKRVSGSDPKILLSLEPYFRGGGGMQWVLLVLLAIAVGPFFEEWLFRGWLLGGLKGRWSVPSALLMSSLLFALGHRNPRGLLGPLLFALIVGKVALRTGSLSSSLAVHTLWNVTTLLYLFASIP